MTALAIGSSENQGIDAMVWPFGKPKRRIDELDAALPREQLVRRSRILIVDDEKPDLVLDLQKAHFAVDYVEDITPENMNLVESHIYDLVLLDFAEVGKHFGQDQGLSLLRHMKRVVPSLVVVTYTSKQIGTRHSDFFRLSDFALSKDAGIAESTEKIEEGLRKAHSIANMWNAFLVLQGIRSGSPEDIELQDTYVRGLTNAKEMKKLNERVSKVEGVAREAIKIVFTKLVELGIKAVIG